MAPLRNECQHWQFLSDAVVDEEPLCVPKHESFTPHTDIGAGHFLQDLKDELEFIDNPEQQKANDH